MKNDTLGLYGPENSEYLRLVERRAAEEGIKTARVDGPTPGCAAYVADTDAGWPMWDLTPGEDVDNIQHPGMSCCAPGLCGPLEHCGAAAPGAGADRGGRLRMAEYIDRVRFCRELCRCNRTECDQRICPLMIIPAADVAPVVHGRWVGLEYDGYADGAPVYDLWECSECGEEVRGEDVPSTHPFCHGCGAMMDGGRDDE